MLSAYLPLLPIFLLLLTPLVMLVIRQARPRFAYFWLIAAFGALLAWPSVLILNGFVPQALALPAWQPEDLFPASPALLVDEISWPFAMALVTLALAVVLTDVARASEADWRAWSGSLALAALGLLAVFSGNPLTLLLAWAAIDLAELLILLNHVELGRERERAVIAFSTRVAGILLLMWAGILAMTGGARLSFAEIPNTASLYLLLASGLRLGVVPLHLPILPERQLRRSLGTMVRLVPAAASLVLLARTAVIGVPEDVSAVLLPFTGLIVVYAGLGWVIARDELDGRTHWMLGMAGLAFAAAVRGQPGASFSWGVSLLLSGGLLFLVSARHRYLLPLLLLGFVSLTTLPFTPTWEAGLLFAAPFSLGSLLLLAGLVLLLMGYLRHALRPGPGLEGVERWVWVIYPWGLALLPTSLFLIAFLGRLEPGSVSIGRLAPGLLSLALLALGIYAWQNTPDLPGPLKASLKSVFSLQWVYRVLWDSYRGLGRFIGFITAVMEGEGGVLWALLLLTLLMALIIQGRMGG